MKKEKSQRQLKVAENIKRLVAEKFMKEGLSVIQNSFVTIKEVDISPDLKNCRIYLDILAAKNVDAKEIVAKIQNYSSNFRTHLSKNLDLRQIPSLEFLLDDTTQNAIDIGNLIDAEGKKFI